jgi:hypothetical protein
MEQVQAGVRGIGTGRGYMAWLRYRQKSIVQVKAEVHSAS